jgi:hypothetical protein
MRAALDAAFSCHRFLAFIILLPNQHEWRLSGRLMQCSRGCSPKADGRVKVKKPPKQNYLCTLAYCAAAA